MEIESVPPDIQDIVVMERRLAAGNLTLSDLQELEDELFWELSEKASELSLPIFARIADKRKTLIDKRAARLEQKGEIESKIEALWLRLQEMDPEEVEQQIQRLENEVALIEDPKVQAAARLRLNELRFLNQYPLAYELSPDAVQSTFASRIAQAGSRITQAHSLGPFKELNATQRREVLRFVKGGV